LDFTHYYGKHKGKTISVVQPNVLHTKKQFRLSGELLKKFNEHKSYSDLTESEFIRELIQETITKREGGSWEKEISEW